VPGFDFPGTVHRLHEDLFRTRKARCESQIVGYGEVRSHGRGAGTNTVQSTLAVAYLSAAGEHPRERYVVESINVVLFWLVPIFYSFDIIPAKFHFIYQYNPLAILVLALRNILLDGSAPPSLLMWKLFGSSLLVFAGGWFIFQSLQRRFYEYL